MPAKRGLAVFKNSAITLRCFISIFTLKLESFIVNSCHWFDPKGAIQNKHLKE